MAQNYNTMSYISATSTIQYSSLWKNDGQHRSHVPTGYTAESQNSVWMCYPHVAPQQLYKGLKYKTKHCTEHHMIFLLNRTMFLLAIVPARVPGSQQDAYEFLLRKFVIKRIGVGHRAKIYCELQLATHTQLLHHCIQYALWTLSALFFFKVPHGHIDAPIGTWKGH